MPMLERIICETSDPTLKKDLEKFAFDNRTSVKAIVERELLNWRERVRKTKKQK